MPKQLPRRHIKNPCFNPCFNGFMDKCIMNAQAASPGRKVSTLVLMDSWINAAGPKFMTVWWIRFNPCFNGFMDKCNTEMWNNKKEREVSTLVLMDSWINARSRLTSEGVS